MIFVILKSIFLHEKLIAPKAQFQLVAVCDVVDFECPPGMCVGLTWVLMLHYLGTDAKEIAKNEAT